MILLTLDALKKLTDEEFPTNIQFEIFNGYEDGVTVFDSTQPTIVRSDDNSFNAIYTEFAYRKYWDGLFGLKHLMKAK